MTERRQAMWMEFWIRAAQMQRQWIEDALLSIEELARGNTDRAVKFMASAAMALEAGRACKNVWHLLRFNDLHLVPQLTSGADDDRDTSTEAAGRAAEARPR